MVLETEVHGVTHAEEIFSTTSGTWATPIIDPPDEAFVFVAMPHSADEWQSITIRVTPLDPGE